MHMVSTLGRSALHMSPDSPKYRAVYAFQNCNWNLWFIFDKLYLQYFDMHTVIRLALHVMTGCMHCDFLQGLCVVLQSWLLSTQLSFVLEVCCALMTRRDLRHAKQCIKVYIGICTTLPGSRSAHVHTNACKSHPVNITLYPYLRTMQQSQDLL